MSSETDAAAIHPPPYEPHIGDTRQYWRDMILGVNDGLVSTILLVAVVVGGGLTVAQVLLTAIGGALAGAISMAASEYLATKSQIEVLHRELALERIHIEHHRDMEIDQLREMLKELGLEGNDLDATATAFARTDARLLNSMKVMEFGLVDSEERSPYAAMATSGVFFLLGSLPTVLSFVFIDDATTGFVIAALLTFIGLFGVGVVKTIVTKTNPIKAGFENLTIAGIGGVIAYALGAAFDRSVGS